MTNWATPITWPAAVVSVAQLNQQIRDNSLYLYEHKLGGYAATLANVQNTVAETTICSFSVPANDWADGDVFFIWMASLNKNNKGTSGTPAIKINAGAGAQVQTFNSAWGNSATEYKAMGYLCSLTRIGNDVWIGDSGIGVLPPQVSNVAGGPFAQGVTTVFGVSTPTNFTSAITVSIKATLDAADATYYIKPQKARIWKVAA